MAPPNSRPPSLPSIPDIAFDFDEKTQLLLPELDEMLSSTADSSTAFDEEDDFRPSRSFSTHTQHSARQRRVLLPTRLPSIGHTYTTLPLSPRRPDLAGQSQVLQLPLSQKTVLESWTITYHHPTARPTSTVQILGLTVRRQTDLEPGSVLSVVPNTHFSQGELAATVAMHEVSAAARAQRKSKNTLSKPATGCAGGGAGVGGVGGGSFRALLCAADLEARLRKLDWKVQDEIHELLGDRVQSSSNAFRRREWRVVVMTQVPGGELTDAPAGFGTATVAAASGRWSRRKWWCFGFNGRRRIWWRRTGRKETLPAGAPEMPVTEYRLILRGTESRANDQGWGYYNRYSRPWRTADEREVSERRRWSTATGRSDKYVDF